MVLVNYALSFKLEGANAQWGKGCLCKTEDGQFCPRHLVPAPRRLKLLPAHLRH